MPDRTVFNLIFDQANAACSLVDDKIELETKIILAIAIRLKAEMYMISVINDQAYVGSITNNQTFELLKKAQVALVNEKQALKTLKQVCLMTPENIHINSFMYEPLLDMSNHHLKKLYADVCTLAGGT